MDSNVFGQSNMQPEPIEKEGNNPTLIAILLVLILGGGGVLAFLLYRQNQEPAPVLDEVSESVELPTDTTAPEVTNELPIVEDSTNVVGETPLESEIVDNIDTTPLPVE